MLLLAAVLLAAAAPTTATISVPADALVFAGPGLLAPDVEGHFAIGVTLPRPRIQAAHCDTPYLVLGMGHLNKPADALTDADRTRIDAARAVYAGLRDAAAAHATIKLRLRNDQRYLRLTAHGIMARYCILSLDEANPPWTPPPPATR